MLNVRKLFLYAALMGCGALQAQEVEIEYERQRAPRYPLSLYEQGIRVWRWLSSILIAMAPSPM